MNYIITESQRSVLRDQIKNSIEEIGIWKTRKRFKLSDEQLFHLLGDDLPDLSCSDYYDIIYSIFSGDKVKKKYNVGRYVLSLYMDQMTGSIDFTCVDTLKDDKITGYATPYWDGECQLPLELSWYMYEDDDGDLEEVELNGEFFESDHLDMKFNSVSEIINWFETDYIERLITYCRDAFEFARFY